MENFKQIKCIEKITWFKVHFNQNRKKRSFMKHNVLERQMIIMGHHFYDMTFCLDF